MGQLVQLFAKPTEAELNRQAQVVTTYLDLEQLEFEKAELEVRVKETLDHADLNDLLVEDLYVITKAIELIKNR